MLLPSFFRKSKTYLNCANLLMIFHKSSKICKKQIDFAMKQRFFIKLYQSYFNPSLVGGVFLPPCWSSFNNSEMVKAKNLTFSKIK